MNETHKTRYLPGKKTKIDFAFGIILFFSLIIGIFLASCSRVSSVEANEVKNICGNLKLPPSFAETAEFNQVKSGSMLRSTTYSSAVEPAEAKDFFVKSLTAAGWRDATGESHLPSTFLRLKKDQYTIEVDHINSASGAASHTYSVTCSVGIW